MKNLLIILIPCLVLSCQKLPPQEAVMHIVPITASHNYFDNMGLVLNSTNDTIYFGVAGKYLHKVELNNPENSPLILTIEEATAGFNSRYGDTYLDDLNITPEGIIYAAAENKILRIDPKKGSYETVVDGGFSGIWGAYSLALCQNEDIFVSDHNGGIHFYQKKEAWKKHSVVTPEETIGPLASFTGVELSQDQKTLCFLDPSNALLFICKLSWKDGIPSAKKIEKVELTISYPEFLQMWQGDIFIKAAREDTLLRVRKNKIIQTIKVTSDESYHPPIVTFDLHIVSEEKAYLYGTTWGPDGTVHKGELFF